MAEAKSNKPADPAAEAQKVVDDAEAKGFLGVEVDPTPNERYSQESSDYRTPESDPEAAAAVGSKRYAGKAAK